jgi:predicted transcriptional regulator of viral defense system
MVKLRKESARQLYEIAETQDGFFTTKQAKAAGYAENTHPYHAQAGNWIREHRGIYRLAHFPQNDRPDLMLWWLWSKNREGLSQGVYSHETALSMHDLTDLMPAKLHMTVPKSFRRNSRIPKQLVLHHADVPEKDTETLHGVCVTRPLRTILDLVCAGDIPILTLRNALREGLQRGVIRRSEVSGAQHRLRDDKKIIDFLRNAAA